MIRRALLAALVSAILVGTSGAQAQTEALSLATTPAPNNGAFGANCTRIHARIAAYRDAGIVFDKPGEAIVTPIGWKALDQEDRAKLIWAVAYRATCQAGQPGPVNVRIIDADGAVLAVQSVTTQETCEGDTTRARGTWYPC